MPCNCKSGGTTAVSTYKYVAPNGTTRIYKSEIEAKAAVARNGGTYTKQ